MTRPRSVEEALAGQGTFRAGGTDLHARRRLGLTQGDVVDLRGLRDLSGIEAIDGGVRIGSLTRISTVATHPALIRDYPALASTAGSLATPQIRAVGTFGGNLLQHNRCPYYRHPGFSCFKSGASSCPAREGDHRHGVIFDLGPCVAPHPSSLAMALMTYDATVVITGDERLTIDELLGDGGDGSCDHQLGQGRLLLAAELPPPVDGERAAYRRATGRTLAEWPTVEAVCRLGIGDDSTIEWAAMAVGGVAPVPLRRPTVEHALVGLAPDDTFGQAAAADLATAGAGPLSLTAYKVPLLQRVVFDTIRRALEGGFRSEVAVGERGL